MNEFYSVKQLIGKLKEAGIKTGRENIFLKIKAGILRPQAYRMIGKRRYPKYSQDYVNKLIACATISTRIDWAKVKQITDSQVDPIQKI